MSMIRFKEDDMLLRAFVESQSEQAFSDLVERHVDLVSRVVYRRIQDHASAQDVVQSVFTLLARKASIVSLLSSMFTIPPVSVASTSAVALAALKASSGLSKSTLITQSIITTMKATQIKWALGLGIITALPLAYQWNAGQPNPSNNNSQQALKTEMDINPSYTKSITQALVVKNPVSLGGQERNNSDRIESLRNQMVIQPDERRIDWKARQAQQLINDLSDGEWKIRRGAAALLNGSDVPADLAVPALRQALLDEEWQVRKVVSDTLASYGVDAASARPELTRLLQDEEWQVRESAAFALSKLGSLAEPATLALMEALEDEQWHVRRVAAEALAEIGPAASVSVDALTQSLNDEEWQVRSPAAMALAMMGTEAEPAISALGRALTDEEWYVVVNASVALANIGPAAAAEIPPLIQALGHQESHVREAAAFALGSVGANSSQAISRLNQLTSDPASNVRLAATEAIQKLQGRN